MLVSFIIPHKGREELLAQTVQSVIDLDVDLQEIEIIVVTQNKTLECLTSRQEIGHVKIIFRPEQETISTLRNKGVEQAAGEYLVFLDADILLSRDWLKVVLAEFQAKAGRVLVSAQQRCASQAEIIEKIRVTLNTSAAARAVQFLDGRNLFLPRSIFQAVSGFPEQLVTCEDYYFTNQVHQLGEVYVTSKTSYVHLGEDHNYAELFRKEIWRGQSNLASFKGRKLTLREIPSLVIPFWHAGFLLLAILAAFWGKLAIGLGSLALFCLPICLYTLRLYRLGKGSIRFGDGLRFYSVYFPARVIGTLFGVFKTIQD